MQNHSLKILLVEDNITNQFVATKILNKLGYQPEIANNGIEALQMVKEKEYDIIFMDVRMPEMDGLEATKKIRSELAIEIPIIALTANAIEGDKQICLNAGMSDYMSKPVRVDDLARMIEKWGKKDIDTVESRSMEM